MGYYSDIVQKLRSLGISSCFRFILPAETQYSTGWIQIPYGVGPELYAKGSDILWIGSMMGMPYALLATASDPGRPKAIVRRQDTYIKMITDGYDREKGVLHVRKSFLL